MIQPQWLRRDGLLWALLVLAALALVVVTAYVPLAGLAVVALTGAALAAVYLVARPWTLFALYLFLLAPHVTLMAILLVQVGLPAPAVKAISAWKEATLLLFLVAGAWRVLRRPSRWVVVLPDVFLLLYSTLTFLYICFSLLKNPSLSVLFYGTRDLMLPVLLYAVGRSLPLTDASARSVFRWMLWAALIFSVLGILEWSFIPTRAHVELGISRYYRELLNLHYSDYYLGLPENYWRAGAAGRVRRAVSIYGSSQSFALSYLMLLPVSIYGMLRRDLPERRLAGVVTVLSMIGLWLTLTRFTIVVCVGLFALWGLIADRRARRLAIVGMIVLGLGFAVAFGVSEDVQSITINTITFRDYSSSSRLRIWGNTVDVVLDQPWGYGLGAVGQTSTRFDSKVTGIEGQLSKVGVELGIVGLVLYLGALLSVAAYLYVVARRIHQPYIRALCAASFLTFLGLTANALTTEWHNGIALVYPSFWLAGSCVSAAIEVHRPSTDAAT